MFLRYSCTTCSMFFMTYEDLQNHGVSLNSRCYQMNHGVRLDPVYSCHLCNFSKASSVFGTHLQGIQHQHKINEEAVSNKSKYGLSYKESFYICAVCDFSSSYDNMMSHMKESPGCFLICSPCGVEIKTEASKHVLTDNHVKNVAKYPQSKRYFSHLLKFKYCCDSCSFSFSNLNDMTKHSNCPKLKFR